jgi:glutaredoxin
MTNRISRLFIAFLACGVMLSPGTALAQEQKDTERRLVFIELFTAEICPFCPQAERNFNDIIQSDQIIGYSCMVDYFESGTHNAYAQPFCRTQQDLYRRKIKGGSRYTPQLILNGVREMPGQNLQSVTQAIRLKRDGDQGLFLLEVQPGAESGQYDVILPDINRNEESTKTEKSYVLRMVQIQRRPPPNAVPLGRIRRDQPPHNLALALEEGGFWDGHATIWRATPERHLSADGLIIMIQDRATGAVIAVADVDMAPFAP